MHIHRKDQPGRLPNNIYGTDSMEWEIYSTPSRDARLKTRFKELRDNMAKLIQMYNDRDPRLSYDGLHLKDSLQKIYGEESEGCKVRYKNTNGRGWGSYRDMSEPAYANRFREMRDLGYRVVDFERYTTANGIRYAGVWRQN